VGSIDGSLLSCLRRATRVASEQEATPFNVNAFIVRCIIHAPVCYLAPRPIHGSVIRNARRSLQFFSHFDRNIPETFASGKREMFSIERSQHAFGLSIFHCPTLGCGRNHRPTRRLLHILTDKFSSKFSITTTSAETSASRQGKVHDHLFHRTAT